VIPIAPGVDWEAAAIATDAIATPIHVMRDRAHVRQGDVVVVVGAGGGVGGCTACRWPSSSAPA